MTLPTFLSLLRLELFISLWSQDPYFMQENPKYSRVESGCTLEALVDEGIFSKC